MLESFRHLAQRHHVAIDRKKRSRGYIVLYSGILLYLTRLVCPSWVFGDPPHPLPFPNLELLDISHNKRLSALPIRAALYPSLKVLTTGTDLLAPKLPTLPPSDVLLEVHHGSWRRKPISLVHICITILLESRAIHDTDLDITEHMSDHLGRMLKQAYMCEICHSTCLPGTSDWRDIGTFGHRRLVVSPEETGYIRMRGRVCSTCVYTSRSRVGSWERCHRDEVISNRY